MGCYAKLILWFIVRQTQATILTPAPGWVIKWIISKLLVTTEYECF